MSTKPYLIRSIRITRRGNEDVEKMIRHINSSRDPERDYRVYFNTAVLEGLALWMAQKTAEYGEVTE